MRDVASLFTLLAGPRFVRLLLAVTPRLSHSLRRLEPRTDPPNPTVRFTQDPAGRVRTESLPDLRSCPEPVEGVTNDLRR